VSHDIQQVRRAFEEVRPVRMLEEIARSRVFRVVVTRVLGRYPLHEAPHRDIRDPHDQTGVATSQTKGEDLGATASLRHRQQIHEVLLIRVI